MKILSLLAKRNKKKTNYETWKGLESHSHRKAFKKSDLFI